VKQDVQWCDDFRVAPRQPVRLHQIPTTSSAGADAKPMARKMLKSCRQELDEALRAFAAENERSLLLILQGMDASGKDGAIRRVFTGVNPQFCRVISFKEPTSEDRERTYLWRIWRSAPRKGELRIFNRSYYEDVLVPRARESLTVRQMRTRLREISDLERTWLENGISIRKIFLHISQNEQTERFRSRLDTPEKRWKVKESDFEDRALWSKFQRLYEQILSRTSTKQAPWYIVPADKKWYRDLVVATIVLGALQDLHPQIPVPSIDRSRYEL
jgi:PPK2 family polyphosphate:nucleotide phosphotransferase